MANSKIAQLPVLKDDYDERSKYDWVSIRNDYVYGITDEDGTIIYPKPKELEEKHKVPAQYISNRASKEKWLKHREAHQNEEAIAKQKEHQKRLANKAVKFDEQVADDSFTAARILGDRLRQIEILQAVDKSRINDIIVELSEGRAVDQNLRTEIKPLISSYEVESIAKAMALVQEVGHKALGVPEGGIGVGGTTIQINQIANASQNLQELDEKRQQALAQFFDNPNVRIPKLGITGKQDEEEIIEGELVDESDDTGLQRAVSTEASGPVHDPHTTSGSADRIESEQL